MVTNLSILAKRYNMALSEVEGSHLTACPHPPNPPLPILGEGGEEGLWSFPVFFAPPEILGEGAGR